MCIIIGNCFTVSGTGSDSLSYSKALCSCSRMVKGIHPCIGFSTISSALNGYSIIALVVLVMNLK